jgi:osmotically-inducible protein OsmY
MTEQGRSAPARQPWSVREEKFMKRYIFTMTLLLAMGAFAFGQTNSGPGASPQNQNPSATMPNTTPPTFPNDTGHDRDANTQQDRDRQDRDHHDADADRNGDQVSTQDRDKSGVYDRDPQYQDRDRNAQQDRDRDQDQNRDRDANRKDNDNDRNRGDMDRDHDRNRVGVGNDRQSQIMSEFSNRAEFSNVNVNVRNDRIDLTGTVPTGRDRNEAVRIAQQYANGLRVNDHLKVSGRGNGDHDRDDHK